MPRRRSIANSDAEREVTARTDSSKGRSRSHRRSRHASMCRSSYRTSRSGRRTSRHGSPSRHRRYSMSRSSYSPVFTRSRSPSRESRKSSVDGRTSARNRSLSGDRSSSEGYYSDAASPQPMPNSPERQEEIESEEEEEAEEEIVLPPKLDLEDFERLLDDDPDRFGMQGAVNLDDNDMKEVVKSMKETLDSRPSDDIYHANPKDMKVELMPHQKHGLAWMMWRERQRTPGGILADDMGLGKTLLTISLILQQKRQRMARQKAGKIEYDEAKKQVAKKLDLVPSNTTLVVAPASVIHQWRAEIRRRLPKGTLKVLMLSGAKNDREDDPEKLAEADVVITSYSLIPRELHLLKGIAFERIVLDEAHMIKNRATDISKAVCRLAAGSHWCLMGTPVHNDLWDLYSLVRFMRIGPFDIEDYWKEFIANDEDKTKCSNRLNVLTRSILLRRTKDQTDPITNQPLVILPPKTIKLHNLTMEGIEAGIYDVMFTASQIKVRQMLEQAEGGEQKKHRSNKGAPNPFSIKVSGKNKSSCVLVMLLRLRQACVHMHLTKEDLDKDEDDIVNQAMARVTLGEENKEEATRAEEVFERSYLSCKMKKLMEIVEEVEQAGEKIVIVSQWASLLNLVAELLKNKEGRVTSITGSVPTDQREERIESFNQENGGHSVMLLSLGAGGVGLNLVGGNHLIMVDLHWNPALEAQACDRIYRMGQIRPVTIHRLIIAGTIEQRVLELQEQKKLLADSVLNGAASKKTVLSHNDIEYLFDLGGK